MDFSPVVNGFNMLKNPWQKPPQHDFRHGPWWHLHPWQVINGHNPKSGNRMLNIESAWLIWIQTSILMFCFSMLICWFCLMCHDVSWCVMMCPSNLRAARWSIRPRGGSIDRCQAESLRPMKKRHVCRSSTPLFLSRRRPITEITMDIATKHIKIWSNGTPVSPKCKAKHGFPESTLCWQMFDGFDGFSILERTAFRTMLRFAVSVFRCSSIRKGSQDVVPSHQSAWLAEALWMLWPLRWESCKHWSLPAAIAHHFTSISCYGPPWSLWLLNLDQSCCNDD